MNLILSLKFNIISDSYQQPVQKLYEKRIVCHWHITPAMLNLGIRFRTIFLRYHNHQNKFERDPGDMLYMRQHKILARNQSPATDFEKGWIINSDAYAQMTPFQGRLQKYASYIWYYISCWWLHCFMSSFGK